MIDLTEYPDIVGLRVHSPKVGIKEKFDGIVIAELRDGFLVLDPTDNTEWVRSRNELSLLNEVILYES
jgi:hypothetical protein